MTKPFLAMLGVVVVLGVIVGGAFVGGVVLGQSQASGGETGAPPRIGSGPGGQPGGFQGRGGANGQRQRGGIPGGGAGFQGQSDRSNDSPQSRTNPEPAAQAQQPTQVTAGASSGNGAPSTTRGRQPQAEQAVPPGAAGRGGPTGRGGFGRGQGAAGTIESTEGDRITITTPQGPVTVITGMDVSIVSITEASKEDLVAGVQVRALGPRSPEGEVMANSVLIVTEEAQGFFGRRPGPRGQ